MVLEGTARQSFVLLKLFRTHSVQEYVEHYHAERNRQGLGNEQIEREDEVGTQCVMPQSSGMRTISQRRSSRREILLHFVSECLCVSYFNKHGFSQESAATRYPAVS